MLEVRRVMRSWAANHTMQLVWNQEDPAGESIPLLI